MVYSGVFFAAYYCSFEIRRVRQRLKLELQGHLDMDLNSHISRVAAVVVIVLSENLNENTHKFV